MTASVDILTTRKLDALSVPLAAVTTRNPKDLEKKEGQGGPPEENKSQNNQNQQKAAKKEENKTVVFINDKGTAKMVEVKTGISDFDNIEILSGISDSTEVISGPFLAVSKRLKDGDKIRSQEKKDDKKPDDK
jgi:HlyD family secretion protein